MYRAAVLALTVVPLARGDYSYSYEAPTMAPTTSTMSPTVTVAPTRSETYSPTRITEAPSYAPTTDTYAPTLGACPPLGVLRPDQCPLDTTGLPPCTDVGLGVSARCVANSVENHRADDVAARNLIPAQVASNVTCPDAPPTTCLAGARRRLREDPEVEHVYVVLGSMVPTAAPTGAPSPAPTGVPTAAPTAAPRTLDPTIDCRLNGNPGFSCANVHFDSSCCTADNCVDTGTCYASP